MVCPKCKIFNDDGKAFCDHCGADLFENNKNDSFDKKNISSIIGIDIDKISREKHEEELPKKIDKSPKTPSKQVSGIFIIIFLVLFILALLGYIFFYNDKNDCQECICENKVETKYIDIKVLSDSFNFVLPEEYDYRKINDDIIIKNNVESIIIKPITKGRIDTITSALIKEKYETFNGLVVKEDILNNHKIFYISYAYESKNYIDFYYQLDSEYILYGEVNNNFDEEVSSDIKKIISSIELKKDHNDYENIIPIFDFNLVLSSIK